MDIREMMALGRAIRAAARSLGGLAEIGPLSGSLSKDISSIVTQVLGRPESKAKHATPTSSTTLGTPLLPPQDLGESPTPPAVPKTWGMGKGNCNSSVGTSSVGTSPSAQDGPVQAGTAGTNYDGTSSTCSTAEVPLAAGGSDDEERDWVCETSGTEVGIVEDRRELCGTSKCAESRDRHIGERGTKGLRSVLPAMMSGLRGELRWLGQRRAAVLRGGLSRRQQGRRSKRGRDDGDERTGVVKEMENDSGVDGKTRSAGVSNIESSLNGEGGGERRTPSKHIDPDGLKDLHDHFFSSREEAFLWPLYPPGDTYLICQSDDHISDGESDGNRQEEGSDGRKAGEEEKEEEEEAGDGSGGKEGDMGRDAPKSRSVAQQLGVGLDGGKKVQGEAGGGEGGFFWMRKGKKRVKTPRAKKVSGKKTACLVWMHQTAHV
ncbi:unnamed protein product [Choristocarpus tenellus]